MELDQVSESNQSNDQGFDEFLSQSPKETKANETKETKENKPVEKSTKAKSVVPGKDIPFNSPEEYIKNLESNEPKLDLSKFKDSESDEELESESEEQSESEDEDLEELNYNGKKEKLTKDQLKEYASKGYDYTQKTQVLANERKEFETEKKNYYAEIDKVTKELEQKMSAHDERTDVMEKWDVAFDTMKTHNPDLFEQVKAYFDHTVRQFDNPAIKRQFDSFGKTIKTMESQLEEYKNKEILSSFSKEMSETKENLGKALSQYGIFPDWDGKVTDQWKKSDMSIKNIVYALYGDQIRAAQESKVNLSDVKAKTINRPPRHSITKKPVNQPKQIGRDNGYNRATDAVMRAVGLK